MLALVQWIEIKMRKEWSPSWWGQKLTGSSDWSLRLDGLKLAMTLAGSEHHVNIEDEGSYRVNAGTFWTDVTFHPGKNKKAKVDGHS